MVVTFGRRIVDIWLMTRYWWHSDDPGLERWPPLFVDDCYIVVGALLLHCCYSIDRWLLLLLSNDPICDVEHYHITAVTRWWLLVLFIVNPCWPSICDIQWWWWRWWPGIHSHSLHSCLTPYIVTWCPSIADYIVFIYRLMATTDLLIDDDGDWYSRYCWHYGIPWSTTDDTFTVAGDLFGNPTVTDAHSHLLLLLYGTINIVILTIDLTMTPHLLLWPYWWYSIRCWLRCW